MFLLGIVILAAAFGSLWIAVPRKGVSPKFMENDVIGLLYPMVPMVLGAAGLALLLR
jgi:hypothetical protein